MQQENSIQKPASESEMIGLPSELDSLMNLNLNMSEEELFTAFLPSEENFQSSPPPLFLDPLNHLNDHLDLLSPTFELDEIFEEKPLVEATDLTPLQAASSEEEQEVSASSDQDFIEIEDSSKGSQKRKTSSISKRLSKKIKQEVSSPIYLIESSIKKQGKGDEKHSRRLESNKRSAQASRERKKQLKMELEAQVTRLQTENKELQTTINELETENKILKSEFTHLQGLVSNSPLFTKFQDPQSTAPTQQFPFDLTAFNQSRGFQLNPISLMLYFYIQSLNQNLNSLPGRSLLNSFLLNNNRCVVNLSKSSNNTTTVA